MVLALILMAATVATVAAAAVRYWSLYHEHKARLDVIKKVGVNRTNRLHAERWNEIWDLVVERFNLADEAGNVQSPTADALFNLMKAEFGSFTLPQMWFLTQIVNHLADAQAAALAAQLPATTQDIVFDKEGGFRLVSKLEPSKN